MTDAAWLEAQVRRIDLAMAETQKLLAEAPKLNAEAAKFRRDPWFILFGVALGGLVSQLPAVLRGLGLIS